MSPFKVGVQVSTCHTVASTMHDYMSLTNKVNTAPSFRKFPCFLIYSLSFQSWSPPLFFYPSFFSLDKTVKASVFIVNFKVGRR